MASISRTPSMASQKQPLPHVSALIQSAESRSASFDARKTLSSQRTAKLRSAPASPQSSSLDLRSTPNIHLLASMPDFSPQDFPPVPTHGRRKSSGVNHSPASKAASIAGESIFELPTPMPMESPNSSVAVSFVAELEDTSEVPNEPVPPLPYKAHLVAPADTSVLFKPNKLTSQALLRVVDETIAGIEAANRELLARAEAAEASAYRLHVSNTELRNRIEELSQTYRPPPPSRSIGVQTSPRTTPKHSPQNSIERHISPVLLEKSNSAESRVTRNTAPSIHNVSNTTSNQASPIGIQKAQVVQIANLTKPNPLHSHPTNLPTPPEPQVEQVEILNQPKSRRSIRSLKFLQRHHADNLAQPLTPSTSKASRQSSDRPRTADATSPSFSSRFEGLGKVPPLPELPIFLSLTSPSSSLDGNATTDDKDGGRRARRHTRTLSFEEAKKVAAQSNGLSKLTVPKNPLGEMSPSPIQGVVEIGGGAQDADKDAESVKPLKSQRSRVRFLLKDNGIKELLERRDREKDKDKKKIGTFFKWNKKGEEAVAA